MANIHNFAGAGASNKMWRMWLILPQAYIIDLEAIVKGNFS